MGRGPAVEGVAGARARGGMAVREVAVARVQTNAVYYAKLCYSSLKVGIFHFNPCKS